MILGQAAQHLTLQPPSALIPQHLVKDRGIGYTGNGQEVHYQALSQKLKGRAGVSRAKREFGKEHEK
jgi:hypothetical protein